MFVHISVEHKSLSVCVSVRIKQFEKSRKDFHEI
jgi:hypothetical protein